MLYTYPDYYDEFKCIADKCEDTCCAGWQIVIDEDTIENYMNYKGEYSSDLHKGIDYTEGVFKQDKCGRCSFLDENKLCNIHKNMGEDALCDTCKRYPRHIEEFENIREYNLSISCPEVAKIILKHTDKVNYVEIDRPEEEEEEFEDYDILLYSYLEEGRRIIKKMLQHRGVSLIKRMHNVWNFADDMQKCIDDNDIFSNQVFELYNNGNVVKCTVVMTNYGYEYSEKIRDMLWKLEMISKDFESQLIEMDTLLYDIGADNYGRISYEYEDWISRHMKELDVYIEQILVYFIYTYMCGAVYDGCVSSKVRMSIVSAWFVNEMIKTRWIKNGKTLEFEDVVSATYQYSRQLEHSDDNLNLMEEQVCELKFFL